MQIRNMIITGFGHFHQLEIADISPGLTLIEGANEAGKTTLMAFIRATLFGFADRRSNELRYEPLQGGEHGGSIVLEDGAGEMIRIQRKPGPARGEVSIYHGDEVWHGEAQVKDLLKGMTEHLFQQIFCFGLAELQRLETIDNAEVSGLIYSAGMGYHTRSYPQIQKDLTERLGSLYKSTGRKPEINRLLRELTEIEGQIHLLEQIPEEYNQLKRELHGLVKVIEGLERGYCEKEAQENWLKNLARASEPFRQLKLIQAELRHLPVIDTFPENGVSRLESWKDQLQEIEGTLRQVEQQRKAAKEELAELCIDQELLAAGPKIQELYAGVQLCQERFREQEQWEVHLAQRQLEMKQCITELGSGWNPERIQYFPIPFAKRELVRHFITRLKNLETEKKTLEQEERQLLGWKEERENEYSEKEREWTRHNRTQNYRRMGSQIIRMTLLFSSGIVAGGIWFFSQFDWVPGFLLIFTAGLLVGGGNYLCRLVREQAEEQVAAGKAELVERQKAQARVESQLKDWERRSQSYQKQRTEYEEEWRTFLEKDQLPGEMKPEDLLELFKLLEKAKEILRHYDEVRANRDHGTAEVQAFAEKTNHLLQAIGRSEVGLEEVAIKIYQLVEEHTSERRKADQAEQLREKYTELENRYTVLKHRQETIASEIAQLLKEGKAEGEEEFRTHSQVYQKRQSLIHSQLEWETAFQMAAASQSVEMTAELERKGVPELEEALHNIQVEKQHLKQQLDQLRHQQGRSEARLDQLEASGELRILKQTRENLIDEIRSRSEEWMVASICQSFLEQARERYERERQPGVLKEASTFFCELTQGRYQRVLRSLSENRLEVERDDQRRLSTDELSRGTAEQLYLAMRFALIREFTRRSLPLPVIMDDILINFDPQRTKAALHVMARLAQENQILFFTCHSHLVDQLGQERIPFTHIKLTQTGLKR